MAAALLALFYPVFRSEQAMAKGMPWLLSAAVLLAVAFTFYMGGLRVDAASLDGSNFAHAQENAYKLLGAVIALLPVYFLEKRYVKFETGAVWYAQIAKLVLGLGLAMAVKSVLKAPLNALLPGGAGDAIRYFVLVLFAGCILRPAAPGYGTPAEAYAALPAAQGVLDGYQTMDALAALNFGAVIALNLQAVGITEEAAVRRGTIRAGFIAGGMLLMVYAMLTHIGGISGAAFPGSGTGAAVLTALADGLFGRVGQVLLAAIFVIACFNTCVGLIASVGEYFHELLPRLPYPAIAAFFALMSMLLANIGLAGILSLSVPVLNAIYPIAIVLIVVEFLPGRFQRTSVWRLSILFTAIQSIPAALPFGPLSTLMNALPLSSLGFGWLLPALIGIGAGLLM